MNPLSCRKRTILFSGITEIPQFLPTCDPAEIGLANADTGFPVLSTMQTLLQFRQIQRGNLRRPLPGIARIA